LLPRREKRRVGRAHGEADSSVIAPARGDRRFGVRHEFGQDPDEVEATLREVLTEIATAHRPGADRGGIYGS